MQDRASRVASQEDARRGLQLRDISGPVRSSAVSAVLQALGQEGARTAAPREGGPRRRLQPLRARLPAERGAEAADSARRRRHFLHVTSALRTHRPPAGRRGQAVGEGEAAGRPGGGARQERAAAAGEGEGDGQKRERDAR